MTYCLDSAKKPSPEYFFHIKSLILDNRPEGIHPNKHFILLYIHERTKALEENV